MIISGVGPQQRCPRLVPTLPVSGPAGDFIFVTGTDAAYIANNAGSYQIIDTGPISSGLTVGSTTITGGTTTRVLYDNAGVLGEYVVSGSGSVAMTTSPTFVTPTLGAASYTSLAGGVITQTSASASAFVSGPNGATNPVLQVDNSTASQADGVKITGGAAGSGTTIQVLSSGAISPLVLASKGDGGHIYSNLTGSGSAHWFTLSGLSNIEFGFQFRSFKLAQPNIIGWTGVDENANTTLVTGISQDSAGVVAVGTGAAGSAAGSLKLTNLITTATSSTGTAAIIDASNVLRPLTSSLRFKANVRDWHPNASQINAFLSLKPILWDYKDGGAKDVVGFSAESLSKIDPELVNYDKDGKPYSNREAALVAYLHEIVKRQGKEIATLRAMISRRYSKRRGH